MSRIRVDGWSISALRPSFCDDIAVYSLIVRKTAKRSAQAPDEGEEVAKQTQPAGLLACGANALEAGALGEVLLLVREIPVAGQLGAKLLRLSIGASIITYIILGVPFLYIIVEWAPKPYSNY